LVLERELGWAPELADMLGLMMEKPWALKLGADWVQLTEDLLEQLSVKELGYPSAEVLVAVKVPQ
jgi:hypothetical protein